MAKHKIPLEVIPSAKRLIHSLREIGYTFPHAVADLVDNSIAADATQVKINMQFDGEDSWLRIADNGIGMTGLAITEAMRFGTDREYNPDELGKFGLGLKTASLSQCSRLTVASRTDPKSRRIEVRQWDLMHVESTNRWEIYVVPADERPAALVEPLQEGTGTVVLWEKLDRVLNYRIPWGDHARKGFFKLAEELDQHLAMVFHRFLSGEARRKKKLKISINGTNVDPWDPFAREENETIKLPEDSFKISSKDGYGLVAYAPYILPAQQKFSSLEAFYRYAGPNKWNFQQGLYIYRADRMLQSGGWSHLRTSDEHTKLARLALDFWPDLDSAFDVNIAKARVNLPGELRTLLKPHIEQLAKQARNVYSSHNIDLGRLESGKTHGKSSKSSGIREKPSESSVPAGPASVLGPRIGHALENAAKKAGVPQALRRIIKVIKEDDPEVAAEIGW